MASGCETCGLRRYGEKNPQSFLGKLWRWHTGWCPGWKRYQKELAKQEAGQEKKVETS